jgi:hypothetical protein
MKKKLSDNARFFIWAGLILTALIVWRVLMYFM